jgi:ketosteroid isomerase-like protein
MADWAGSWRSWRIQIEDVVEVAQDKVLIVARHVGEGLASGARVEHRGAALYTFRRGKILRVDGFLFSDEESVSEAIHSIVAGTRAPR